MVFGRSPPLSLSVAAGGLGLGGQRQVIGVVQVVLGGPAAPVPAPLVRPGPDQEVVGAARVGAGGAQVQRRPAVLGETLSQETFDQ